MFNNSYKMLFFFSMLLGSLISVSSSSWFGMWMGLEINLLSFIPLMLKSKNLFSTEAAMKYFFTQTIASAVLLFSMMNFMILFYSDIYSFKSYFSTLMSSTLLMKMGSAPFHFWFPSVMEGLEWNMIFILMTWQKLAPLSILSYLINLEFLIVIVFLSMIFSSLGGLNQTSMRKLMAFSSINHLGWMLTSLMSNEYLWFYYFLFYCFLNFNIIKMMEFFKIYNLNQTFYFKKTNIFFNLIIFFSLLSLGGLPPFLGFFPKWMLIEMMSINKNILLLNFMLFFTLITLFFYLRVTYNSLLMSSKMMKWNFKAFTSSKKMKKKLIFLNFLNLFGLLIINLFFYIF